MFRILYVDDEPGLLDIGKLFLEREGVFSVITLTSARMALEYLNKEHFDAIISDYQMPETDGITFLKRLKASGNSTPFIIFTGRGCEEIVIEALNNGADFYIRKGSDPQLQFAELSDKIRSAITRKHAVEELRESERRFRQLSDATRDGLLMHRDGIILEVNAGACALFGYSRDELIGMQVLDLVMPGSRDAVREKLRVLSEEPFEIEGQKKNGTRFLGELHSPELIYDNPQIRLISVRDITESRQGEDELFRSRQMLQLVLDNIPVRVFWKDRQSVYLGFNRAFALDTGFAKPPAAPEQMTDYQTSSPEIAERFRADDRYVMESGQSKLNYEEPLVRPDGSRAWLRTNKVPLRDRDENVIGVLCTYEDITVGKRAEEELRAAFEQITAAEEELRNQNESLEQSQSEWESTFNAISDWITLITPDGKIIRTNKAAESLLGVPSGQVIGRNCFEHIHGNECQVDDCPRRRMLESRKREVTEIPMREGNRWVQVTVDPVINASGEVVSAVHIVRDISERTRSQKALVQAKRKLNLLNYVTFTDIQNLIFTLSGYQQLIKDQVTERSAGSIIEKQEEILQKINHSLKFAQSYQDLGIKPPKWQNANHVFLLAISHLDFLRIKHTVLLDNLEIFADPLLEKVFQILSENTLTHGKTATGVTLRYVEGPESVTLFFEDNGVGIAEAIKNKIFLPEFQKKKGVGLFLAGEILDITGIALRETGETGKGARFELIVPKGTYRINAPW